MYPPRLEKSLHLLELYKPLPDPGGGFNAEIVERRFQK
jgi:hypothetical protein